MVSPTSTRRTATRAVIYARISSDAEGLELGVERQQKDCLALAKSLGYSVTATYVDNDRGASELSKKPRPEYDAMLASIADGEVDVVLAYSNSRLTRRSREMHRLIDLHRDYGVEYHTVVSGKDDLSTADGRMVAKIKADVDAAEAERIGERTARRFKEMAESGVSVKNGRRPFGWQSDYVTLHPEEAPIFRKAIDSVLSGIGLSAIAEEWNAAGVKPVGSPAWNHRKIRPMLSRWRLCGVRIYQGEPLRDTEGNYVMGDWEPLISIDKFEVLQEILSATHKPKKQRAKHVLSGFLSCGECGGKVYGAAMAKPPSLYACAGGVGHSIKVSAPAVEAFVLDVLAQRLDQFAAAREKEPEVLEEEIEISTPFPDQEALISAQRNLGELNAAILAGSVGVADSLPLFNALTAEVKRLKEARLEHVGARYAGAEIAVTGAEFRALSVDRQRPIIAELVEAIVLNRGVRGKPFNPERLQFIWR